jgi:hypothetical protein
MYDLATNPLENRQDLIEKWARWLIAVRRGDANAEAAIDIKGAQNINPDKLKRKCYKVNKFLETGELVTEEELKSVKHGNNDESEDEDVDSD